MLNRYLAAKSEAEVYNSELKRKHQAIIDDPELGIDHFYSFLFVFSLTFNDEISQLVVNFSSMMN